MKPGVILSLEQATSLPYATQRFVQLGWRVIRIEATATHTGGKSSPAGDPNRYIGHDVGAGADRHAGFIAANVGKEAISINLKTDDGKALLKQLIVDLKVDAFFCNVLPMRYQDLGIDYESLSAVKPDLIWAGISALGPAFPTVAGYDPIIQALCGLMDLNGEPDRAPNLIGVPLTDLKAGDELFASVLLALIERAEDGRGKRIDISMFQAAAALLVTVMPLVDMGGPPQVLTRAGNAHRQFIPTHVYPASDGHLYLAIGSNAQWAKLLSIPGFETLMKPEYETLPLRTTNRLALYADIGAITQTMTLDTLRAAFAALNLPHSTINTVPQAMAHPGIASKLPITRIGDKVIRLPPPASDIQVRTAPEPAASTTEATPPVTEYAMAPAYGEHTNSILAEIGMPETQIADLTQRGVVA